MTFKIEIELDDTDLERFRTMFDQARRVADSMDEKEILSATRELVGAAAGKNPVGFIRERIQGLGGLVAMLEDHAWKLGAEDRARVVQALAYFVNPDDLIPDQTPGLGFLDDAIAAELVLQSLAHELEAYGEFCEFRDAEAVRRRNRGLDTDISKEDWLADKRAVLHSRMRERRASGSAGWRLRALGW